MTSKEINRTKNKLWLLFNCYTVIVVFGLHLSSIVASETEKETLQQNVTSIENNSTSQKPVAEPLIRYRRQPPRTIVKHIMRSKRYKTKRMKRPKIKYSFAEPPPTYYSRKPIIFKKPTFDSSILEDFSHMNVESADFDLPPSSYESQSMDLDLYNHYEPSIEAASYRETKKPSFYTYAESEHSYKEPSSYTYSAPEIGYKESNTPTGSYSYAAAKPRKPHTKYGVPTEIVYSSGYDKHSGNKYTFEPPASKAVYTEVEKPFYNEHAENEYPKEVPRIPATKYGVPDVHIPTTGSNDYNKYSVVAQQPPYSIHAPAKTKTYHFAEPPQPEPSVEITYSPSYEINIPARHENSYSRGKHNAQNHEPAQHPATPQHLPPNYEEPSYQEQPNYEETPEQYHPPTNYQPTNNFESQPQENYEVIGPAHQDVSGTNQPASYQPAPPKHHGLDEYIPASQDLPINVNHKQRPYDYPKSSYEVPIYDPIPFDASNHQEREIYPPQTFDEPENNKSEPPKNRNFQAPPNNPSERGPAYEEATPNDEYSSNTPTENIVKRPQSPINNLRRTRKRKRNKGSTTTVSTTKHILDAPELEEAFEKENRHKFTNSQEPDVDESQRFENINNNNRNNINDNYSKGSWNPMRIRTSPIILMSTPSTISSIKTLDTKNKRHYYYKQQRTHTTTKTTTSTSTTTTTESPVNVEIISIEKSRSKTYYDGVISTPRIYNTNLFRNRFRLEKTTTSTSTTPEPPVKSKGEINFYKRTTKNIFDTTIFKSPLNDRDIHHNLPKNHKLF